MSTPVIGLTTYNDKTKYGFPIAALQHKYITALPDAGSAPVMIPSGLTENARESLLGHLDGLLLTGGEDVAIERFNGEAHPRVEGVDLDRDSVELALLQAVAESGIPFLGICRGFQVVNVALGGTLFTHIQDQFPGAIKHEYDSISQRQLLAHAVFVEKASHLASILGEINLDVNSLHHQGAKDLSPVLRPAGYAPDGLVEAMEFPGHPFGLAVQWHPEWLTDQPVTRRLFRAFVEAAGNR
jgi:putative glutamine amidotransferase